MDEGTRKGAKKSQVLRIQKSWEKSIEREVRRLLVFLTPSSWSSSPPSPACCLGPCDICLYGAVSPPPSALRRPESPSPPPHPSTPPPADVVPCFLLHRFRNVWSVMKQNVARPLRRGGRGGEEGWGWGWRMGDSRSRRQRERRRR